jgi:hypothetical protein
MTKSPYKLSLRKETLRTLNTIDLARVVGGDGTATNGIAAAKTEDAGGCPLRADLVLPGK